ncbi:Deoxycytidine monophosphate (dCMP) deaminase [Podila epigama]|nr:Deoxycytidine monophosphate (dCMP) deaminase [Podila epigama]
MFIGIVGPSCSGKHEVAKLLVKHHGFQQLGLRRQGQRQGLRNDQEKDMSLGEQRRSSRHVHEEFDTIEEMLDYVTLHWMGHYVTCDVHTVYGISILRKRPFFLLLSIESPMMLRYQRNVTRCKESGSDIPTLEEFVNATDEALYSVPSTIASTVGSLSRQGSAQSDNLEPDVDFDLTINAGENKGSVDRMSLQDSPHGTVTTTNTNGIPNKGLDSITTVTTTTTTTPMTSHRHTPAYKLLSMSDLSLLNHSSNIQTLWQDLQSLDITNPDLLRPSWDSYFMYLANLAARRSNCMKRRVGCVLVREKRVIATGYNGTPKNLTNCNDGGCNRCNAATPCGKGLDRCLCMHAEENALLEAGRERVGQGSTIYCNTCPCLGCAIKIVQVGVSEVVYSESYGMDDLTAEVFRKAGVVLRQHATTGLKLDQSSS